MHLTLIHTNDSHGRFGAKWKEAGTPPAEKLRELLAEFPEALYLDAGDTVQAGNLGFRLGGEPALEVLSDLGCKAMCLGNRETHPRKEIFPLKVGSARHPLLCANVTAKGDAPLPVRPHVVLDAGGCRVGVFGVTVPMFTRKQWSQALCDYWFDDPLKTAEEQVALLRPQVDVLVALTHIGFRQDHALAARCGALDLIIGGHSHTDLPAPEVVNGVPILQVYAFAFYAGIARLEVRNGRAELVRWERRALRDRPVQMPGI